VCTNTKQASEANQASAAASTHPMVERKEKKRKEKKPARTITIILSMHHEVSVSTQLGPNPGA
jgi:hypothetical protein